MTKVYFTRTGTKHYLGMAFFKPDMGVTLQKEPDNPFDREAIQVTLPGLGVVGHVANSPYTVLGESMSAGRLYDKIGDTATGIVRYVLQDGVACELVKEGACYGQGLGENPL